MAKKAGPGAGVRGQWRSPSPERSPGCRMGAAFPIASTKVHTGYEGDSAGTEQPGRDNQLQDGRWAVPLRAFPYRGSRCRCRLALLEPDSAPAVPFREKALFSAARNRQRGCCETPAHRAGTKPDRLPGGQRNGCPDVGVCRSCAAPG